jgi:hypothetical protein
MDVPACCAASRRMQAAWLGLASARANGSMHTALPVQTGLPVHTATCLPATTATCTWRCMQASARINSPCRVAQTALVFVHHVCFRMPVQALRAVVRSTSTSCVIARIQVKGRIQYASQTQTLQVR